MTNKVMGGYLACLGFAVLMGAPRDGNAVPMHVNAGGGIDYVSELTQAQVGDTWSLSMTYDTATPDSRPDVATRGLYFGFSAFELTVGSQTYTLNDLRADASSIYVDDNRPTYPGKLEDSIFFYAEIGSTPLIFNLYVATMPATVAADLLVNDGLPADPLQLESLFLTPPGANFSAGFTVFEYLPDDPQADRSISGNVSHFSASVTSVPEPTVLALMIPSLLMLGVAVRRRRTSAG